MLDVHPLWVVVRSDVVHVLVVGVFGTRLGVRVDALNGGLRALGLGLGHLRVRQLPQRRDVHRAHARVADLLAARVHRALELAHDVAQRERHHGVVRERGPQRVVGGIAVHLAALALAEAALLGGGLEEVRVPPRDVVIVALLIVRALLHHRAERVRRARGLGPAPGLQRALAAERRGGRAGPNRGGHRAKKKTRRCGRRASPSSASPPAKPRGASSPPACWARCSRGASDGGSR